MLESRRFTLSLCLVPGEKVAPEKTLELCRGGNWISAKECSNSTRQGGPSWEMLEMGRAILKRHGPVETQGRNVDWRQSDLFSSFPITDEAEGTLGQCLMTSNKWVMGWVGIGIKL